MSNVVQALGQVAALRQQQALLRTHVQGEVALASSECTHQLESCQYKLRQKAMLLQGEAQGESLTLGKLQAYIGQVLLLTYLFLQDRHARQDVTALLKVKMLFKNNIFSAK